MHSKQALIILGLIIMLTSCNMPSDNIADLKADLRAASSPFSESDVDKRPLAIFPVGAYRDSGGSLAIGIALIGDPDDTFTASGHLRSGFYHVPEMFISLRQPSGEAISIPDPKRPKGTILLARGPDIENDSDPQRTRALVIGRIRSVDVAVGDELEVKLEANIERRLALTEIQAKVDNSWHRFTVAGLPKLP